MVVAAFIPVRGGSKSIPRKNILPMAGKPLVHWVAQAACECPLIDVVYVASEDEEIRAVACELRHDKLMVIDRDPSTATDTASTESAMLDFASRHSFDVLVLIQATSPLLEPGHLTAALTKYRESGCDSMLSVIREYRFRWEQGEGSLEPSNYDPRRRPRRQDWEGELVENGAFYVTTREALLETGCRLSGHIEAYEMPPSTAVEIDERSDWTRVEELLYAKTTHRAQLHSRAERISLVAMDVDGTLTDAGMYYGPQGEELKKFNTRDGMGIGLLHLVGVRTAIVTAEASGFAAARARKLGIETVITGAKDKAEVLRNLAAVNGIGLDQIAFIGDDVNDLPALEVAGLAACPGDATASVRRLAHYVCRAPGGGGAVRELADLIIAARSKQAN
ncbi:MAG: acylneuraminate cytidylyltransferase [Myxococcota bacterium]|jgi:N-acylneuraminate cytidylyltransferase|nr:acylneuraminate cytidylyltransferase [Myxococcota bacterium]